jgi:hypothetical protein
VTRPELVRLLAVIRDEVERTGQNSDPMEYIRSNHRLAQLLGIPEAERLVAAEREA